MSLNKLTSTTLKASWIGASLAAILMVSGCNSADNSANTEAEAEANDKVTYDQTDVSITEPTDVKPADNGDVFVMTTLGLESINNLIFTPLIASDTLSAEQDACLESRDDTLGQAELQAFYNEKFTKAELDELAAFYSTEVGEKLLEYGRQEIVLMNGGEVANPVADPTDAEISEIQTFMQTPTGSKYTQINNAVGEGSAIAALEMPMDAEFKRCNVDLTFAQLMQPAPAPTAG